jgi:hypothetical protein
MRDTNCDKIRGAVCCKTDPSKSSNPNFSKCIASSFLSRLIHSLAANISVISARRGGSHQPLACPFQRHFARRPEVDWDGSPIAGLGIGRT